ncbi:probable ATP-dependent helicase PF08_0048 [Daktulosphaira vitifoliae]|uniref:probable ATP-dependent helicase PF08_0048 n=1 Tax=Daktulosphaira vitifoliae TaxID=58002 RepID=UPI0021AA5F7F|nr:probable ATP-dependent helicase PF08_0048 [Daktulosphaira vitifoliae]
MEKTENNYKCFLYKAQKNFEILSEENNLAQQKINELSSLLVVNSKYIKIPNFVNVTNYQSVLSISLAPENHHKFTYTDTINIVDKETETFIETSEAFLQTDELDNFPKKYQPTVTDYCQTDTEANLVQNTISKTLFECFNICDTIDNLFNHFCGNLELKKCYQKSVKDLSEALKIKNEENNLLKKICGDCLFVNNEICGEIKRLENIAMNNNNYNYKSLKIFPNDNIDLNVNTNKNVDGKIDFGVTDPSHYFKLIITDCKKICMSAFLSITKMQKKFGSTKRKCNNKHKSQMTMNNTGDNVANTNLGENLNSKHINTKEFSNYEIINKFGKKLKKSYTEDILTAINVKNIETPIDEDQHCKLFQQNKNIIPKVIAKFRDGMESNQTKLVQRSNIKHLLNKIATKGFGSLTFQQLSFMHHKIIENSVEHFQKYKSLIDFTTKHLPSWQRSALSSKQDIVYLFAVLEGILIRKDEDALEKNSALNAELADIKHTLVSTIRDKNNFEKQLALAKIDNEKLEKEIKKINKWFQCTCFCEVVVCTKNCLSSHLSNMEKGDFNKLVAVSILPHSRGVIILERKHNTLMVQSEREIFYWRRQHNIYVISGNRK